MVWTSLEGHILVWNTSSSVNFYISELHVLPRSEQAPDISQFRLTTPEVIIQGSPSGPRVWCVTNKKIKVKTILN